MNSLVRRGANNKRASYCFVGKFLDFSPTDYAAAAEKRATRREPSFLPPSNAAPRTCARMNPLIDFPTVTIKITQKRCKYPVAVTAPPSAAPTLPTIIQTTFALSKELAADDVTRFRSAVYGTGFADASVLGAAATCEGILRFARLET